MRMLSLLLTEQKNSLAKEYRLRFINIILVFIICAVVVWGGLMLPSYFAISVEKRSLANRAEQAVNIQLLEDKEVLEESSKILMEQLEVFAIDTHEVPTDIVAAITKHQSAAIAVESIELLDLGTAEEMITVRGSSRTREGLRAFTDALSAGGFFENVSLPLSNFVKETDIPFTLELHIISHSHDA